MIVYTLLSHYHNIDKTNVVLTAMIMYIIVYIIVEPEWNYLALAGLALIDLILMQDWAINPFPTLRRFYNWLKSLSTLKLPSLNLPSLKLPSLNRKTKDKSKHKSKHKSKDGRVDERPKDKRKNKRKSKRVRFATHNEYYEYPIFDGFSRVTRNMPMDRMQAVNTRMPATWAPSYQQQYAGSGPMSGLNSGAMRGSQYTYGDIPQWQLTPLQQMQQIILMQKMQAAKAKPNSRNKVDMIDNRHLAVNTDPSVAEDASIASDVSSELSNYEEGIFD
jgi:hypothetical protein